MSTAVMIVITVLAVGAATGIGFLLWSRARTLRLRRRFGPEYDRAVARRHNRRAAERELRSRERRHDELDILPLDDTTRGHYREQWVHVQEEFVDSPSAALTDADRLVIKLMGDRGYPTSGFDERIAYLSVEHGRTIDYYRRGHEISCRAERDEASTEDMRQAMVHYRALFEELLAVPAPDHAATARPDRPDSAARWSGEESADPDTARVAETGVPAEVAIEESRSDDERLRRAAGRDAGAATWARIRGS
jgi:hypothetical protein